MTTDRAALAKAIIRLRDEGMAHRTELDLVCEAATAHLATLPKPPRMVEVWRVEYAWRASDGWEPVVVVAQYAIEALARNHAAGLGSGAAPIKVTGPHLQEVPA